MTGQTFLYSLWEGWGVDGVGIKACIRTHSGTVCGSTMEPSLPCDSHSLSCEGCFFLPGNVLPVEFIRITGKLQAYRMCISYSTVYKEPCARPHPKFVHLRITWGFWLINVSSQLISPKPHFRSGEPVCDHWSWAWPARHFFRLFYFSCHSLRQGVLCGPYQLFLWHVAPSLLSSSEMNVSFRLEGTCITGNIIILPVLCSWTTFHVMLGRHWSLDL